MARSNQRTNETNVVPLPNRPKRKEQDYTEDSVFFTKRQVVVGATLIYMGRLDPGTEWEIIRIVTLFRQDSGKTYLAKPRSIQQVSRFADDIYMRNKDTGDERNATFGYLCYSAIWRVK